MVPDELTHATFARLLGEAFCVEVEGADLELRLIALEPPGDAGAPSPTGFSVEFVGPRDPWLPQRIYALDNDRLALPMIFLVPIGPGDDGLPRYQAVFNR